MADTTETSQDFLSRFTKRLQGIPEAAGSGYETLRKSEPVQAVKGRAGTIGAGLAGTAIVGSQLQQQQPMGAVIGGIGSAIGGIVGTLGRKTALGKLVGGGIGAGIGGLLGEGSEIVKAAVTGAGKGTAPGGTEPPTYIPGTNIPSNEMARYLESQKAIGNLQLDFSNRMSAADRAGMKDIEQHSIEMQLQLIKRQAPYIQQAKDQEMVRTQALMNTSGNIDARLGLLATQGALAKGAQAEAGALARTFAGTNPYAQFANRQSPNIQFG